MSLPSFLLHCPGLAILPPPWPPLPDQPNVSAQRLIVAVPGDRFVSLAESPIRHQHEAFPTPHKAARVVNSRHILELFMGFVIKVFRKTEGYIPDLVTLRAYQSRDTVSDTSVTL